MTVAGLPLDARVEPTREILRRLHLSNGATSLRAEEVALCRRARELAVQGWLVYDGDYPCYGTAYSRFKTGPRLDDSLLKDF